MTTTLKVHLRDEKGEKDSFVTSINLSEQEAHDYYIGKWWNMGVVEDRPMKCVMVETISVK